MIYRSKWPWTFTALELTFGLFLFAGAHWMLLGGRVSVPQCFWFVAFYVPYAFVSGLRSSIHKDEERRQARRHREFMADVRRETEGGERW